MSKLMISVLSFLSFIAGCSNSQGSEDTVNKDGYDPARKSAWIFVEEKEWDDRAEENWQSAAVTKTTASPQYEWLNQADNKKELLVISFTDKENMVTGTPSILVDPATNQVVGYMPAE